MGLRELIRRTISKWKPYKEKRNKVMWHVPKRSSFYQLKGIIQILLDLELDNRTWGTSNKNRVNRELARRRLTQSRTMLTSSAFGTLVAMVKYFGYIYVNEDRKIMITKAAKRFIENPTDQFKEQILKLQITNPLILSYCENIFVFPFKEILKLLLILEYLTMDEIGYVVFMNFKNEGDFEKIVKEILKFRALPKEEREKEIEEFKETPEGHVTLAKAPSSSYFIKFLSHAQICEIIGRGLETKIKLINKSEIESLIKKYEGCRVFDFKDNLDLWIKYIGDPDKLCPPREIIIKLKDPAQKGKLILIYQNNELIGGDEINAVNEIKVPLFDNEEFVIKIFEIKNGKLLGKFKMSLAKEEREIIIDLEKVKIQRLRSKEDRSLLIREHIESDNYDSEYSDKLETLKNILGKEIEDGRLRGGRLEFLVYKLLEQLKKEGLINELKWNGGIKKYGIAQPAPGLLPDIIFNIKDIYFILEITTIKARSTQWSAEGASVPDHIRDFSERNKNKKVVGIFCAPIQHERNINILKNSLRDEKIPILCYEVDELISILLSKDPLNEFLKDIK